MGSVIVPMKLGRFELVTKSPAMLVSLAGSSLNVPGTRIGGVVLIRNVS